MRVSKDQFYLNIAQQVAQRSTCPRGQVGAVAVLRDTIVGTGYNGTARGLPHCTETGCLRGSDGKHLFLVHAEENAIVQSARSGISLLDASLYITHFPCPHCVSLIIQAGITRIYFGQYWFDDKPTDEVEYQAAQFALNTVGIQAFYIYEGISQMVPLYKNAKEWFLTWYTIRKEGKDGQSSLPES